MPWIRTATPTGISRGAVECCTRRDLPREGARPSSPVGSLSVAGTKFVAPLSRARALSLSLVRGRGCVFAAQDLANVGSRRPRRVIGYITLGLFWCSQVSFVFISGSGGRRKQVGAGGQEAQAAATAEVRRLDRGT